jgi:hypothetical protein
MGTHHLILGKTTDFLTGQSLVDTHDERRRQQLARFLVEEKGYAKKEIQARQQMQLQLDKKTGQVFVDFVVHAGDNPLMLILYRPGSIVSRRRTAVAAARIFYDKAIARAVVTNAEDAEIIDTATGRVTGTGLEAIVSRSDAARVLENQQPLELSEVLTQKECDEYTCQNI